MNKTKIAVIAAIVGAIAVASIVSIVSADTTPLAVTCSGAVSNNQITWTATPSGGNAPYTLAWSGDSSVAGSTSTSILATYTANSTYTAMIQATDSSSTVATSTCSATVTSIVAPTATSTLNVIVAVNNTAGGSAVASNFTVDVSGADANPNSFSGSPSGTSVVLDASSTYSVGISTLANYTAGDAGNCSGSIAAGGSASCTITETYVVPTATPTSTLPRVNPPSLSIGANGAFLARGMTVTSIASGSFQATVWGVTYTVNWSGNLYPEFYYRNGNGGGSTTNPTQEVAVGDEVGVSGRVSASSPLVVTANVVRDYSITQSRPKPMPRSGFNFFGAQGGTSTVGNGNTSTGISSSVGVDLQGRLSDLLNQLHNLQGLFNKGH